MIVLVLGATGLLGNAMFRILSQVGNYRVFGTIRNMDAKNFFSPELRERLLIVGNLEERQGLFDLFNSVKPNVVINCIALRQFANHDLMRLISTFSLLPRNLAYLCRSQGIRLVHISSDAVFQGSRGAYTEEDIPDPSDPYGVAKYLGEVNEPGMLTLRTSIIGHEIIPMNGLLEWFLSRESSCKCYTRAIYSGFPSVVLAQIIRDFVLPHAQLHGIYHLASRPISKFSLLELVAQKYKKNIYMIPDDTVVIDRSLSAAKFTAATGFVAPDWPTLIDIMHSERFGLRRVNVY